jgi:hypothetical protein
VERLTAYSAMFMGQTSLLGAKKLWKMKAPRKCLFFCGWFFKTDVGRHSDDTAMVCKTTMDVRFVPRKQRSLIFLWDASTTDLAGSNRWVDLIGRAVHQLVVAHAEACD